MSDEAFRILSRPKWDPRNLQTAAQKELRRGDRVQNFVRQHREQLRDPMTTDITGWDGAMASGSPWPWCFRCKSIVKAYGVEDREKPVVTVWAKCHGTKQALRIEKPSRDILQRDSQWLRRQLPMLVFFAT